MKKALLVLFVIVLFVFVSCNMEVTCPTGTIQVVIDPAESRGIQSISMETVKYGVVVTNASGTEVFNVTGGLDAEFSASVEPGKYKVVVTALNKDGVPIGTGSDEKDVEAGRVTTFKISVSEIAGSGSLEFAISSEDGIPLSFEVFSSEGKPKGSGELTYSDGKYSGSIDLDNGFYVFTLKEGDSSLVSSSVRIINGQTATYEAAFVFFGDGSLVIVNEVAQIPAIVLEQAEDKWYEDSPVSVKATISVSDFSYQWVVDGAFRIDGYTESSGGSVPDFEKTWDEPGQHSLALFVKTDSVIWSEKVQITVEHVHVKVLDSEGKKPSLLENGYTETSHCSVCGEVLSTGTVVEKASPRPGNSRYGFDQFASEPNKQRFYDSLYLAAESVVESMADYYVNDEGRYVVCSFDIGSDFGLTIEDAVAVWKVFLVENPRYYFLKQEFVACGETVTLLIDGEYATYAKRQMYDASISQMEQECAELFSENDLPLTKAVRIHDYIAGKITYAWQEDGITPETPETSIWTHNITGVSYLGRGVCESYAKAFLYLCNLNGVECLIVDGRVKENDEAHAWNYICIDDEWFLVDVTFDDSGNEEKTYYYFGLDSEKMTAIYSPHSEKDKVMEYQYLLPELNEKQMMIVDVFKNGKFVGVYASPDRAVNGMSGRENEFEIVLYNKALEEIEVGGFILHSTTYELLSEVLPDVKKIKISYHSEVGFDEDFGVPQYKLGYMTLVNDVWAGCDLEIDGLTLTIKKTLHLNGHSFICSGVASMIFGFDDESMIEGWDCGSSIIIDDVTTKPGFYLRVVIDELKSTSNNTCTFMNETRIRNLYSGSTFHFVEGNGYTSEIENIYMPSSSSMVIIVESLSCSNASLKIGNIISSGWAELYIGSIFDGAEYYPTVYVYGKTDCKIRLSLLGQMTILTQTVDFSTGEIITSTELRRASPYMVEGPLILINPAVALSQISVSEMKEECLELKDNSIYVSSSVVNSDGYSTYNGEVLAFYGKSTTPILPSGCNIIGDCLFENTEISSISIPNGYKVVGREAFGYCTELTNINLPDTIEEIKANAFVGCHGLTAVEIPSGVEILNELLFWDCYNLNSITIPNSVSNLCWWAFYGCTSLTMINFNGTIAQWLAIEKEEGWAEGVPSTCIVHCSDGDVQI